MSNRELVKVCNEKVCFPPKFERARGEIKKPSAVCESELFPRLGISPWRKIKISGKGKIPLRTRFARIQK